MYSSENIYRQHLKQSDSVLGMVLHINLYLHNLLVAFQCLRNKTFYILGVKRVFLIICSCKSGY